MSRRQCRLIFVKLQPTRTMQTLCSTSHTLLNMGFASHIDDRLHLIELQLTRLMHRKNVCTPVTPIRETEPLQTQIGVFKEAFSISMFTCCDKDSSVWTAGNLIHQHVLLQLHL